MPHITKTMDIKEQFFVKLETRIQSCGSLLCVGLDPHKSQLPANATAEDAYNLCANIVQQTEKYAAAFKPNMAFFECFGATGIEALKRVIAMIPDKIPIVLDCKRGDIDSTANAYAEAAYDYFGADSVTLSSYMGWDSVRPFVSGDRFGSKGAWVLCKTSNQSAKDIQELTLSDGMHVYEKVVDLCQDWNSCSVTGPIVGVVAGATDITALTRIRQCAPDIWILCPGIGSQGGDVKEACSAGLRSDGSGILLSVSRTISSSTDMEGTARALRDEINAVRATLSTTRGLPMTTMPELLPYQRDFIELSVAANALQFGTFRLKSGRDSPYFFNAGMFCTGSSLRVLGKCYAQAIRNSGFEFDVVFGPAYKGIPLSTSVVLAYSELYGEDKEVCYNRKEVKSHGEGGQLVGATVSGKRVLIVDDVITAGTAIRETIDILTAAGADIVGVVVSLDRQERISLEYKISAVQNVIDLCNIPVIAVATLQDLITYMSQIEQVEMAAEKKRQGEEERVTISDRMKEYREIYGAKPLG